MLFTQLLNNELLDVAAHVLVARRQWTGVRTEQIGSPPAAAWINDGTGKFRKEQPLIDGGSPATGTIVKMFGGCKTCGYVSYYGRFVPRSDLSMSARRPLAG